MPGPEDKKGFAPTEEQILKELKQREMRKKYMTSPAALVNRKAYQQKRQAEAKQMREYLKANPTVEKQLKEKYGI